MLVVGAGITGLYQLYRAARSRVLGAAARGRQRCRRHLVLEPLPRRAVRLRELHLRLPLLRRSSSTSGSGRSTSPASPRSSATSTTSSTASTCAATSRSTRGWSSAVWDATSGTWVVTVADGAGADTVVRARFLIAATGVLSVPYVPDVPGRGDFRGVQHHTGRWPAEPVDFVGKRVAVIGTSSSGVQVVPTVLDDVASITVYQRTANWCTPLNNRPITDEEQAELRAGFEDLRETLNTSMSGFAHPVNEQLGANASAAERRDAVRAAVEQPRVHEAHEQLRRPVVRRRGQRRVVRVHRREDPRHRARSGDGRAADPEGPPLRWQAPAVRARLLRGVQRPEGVAGRPPRHSHRARHRDGASRPPTACASSTSSCGPPASTSAPARSAAWGSSGATASRSPTTGPTVRPPSSACRPAASPTSSSPAVRTRRRGTTRATTATSSTSSPTRSCTRATTASTSIEVERGGRGALDRGWSTRAPRPRRSGRSVSTWGRTSRASRAATCSTPAAGSSCSRSAPRPSPTTTAPYEMSKV